MSKADFQILVTDVVSTHGVRSRVVTKTTALRFSSIEMAESAYRELAGGPEPDPFRALLSHYPASNIRAYRHVVRLYEAPTQ